MPCPNQRQMRLLYSKEEEAQGIARLQTHVLIMMSHFFRIGITRHIIREIGVICDNPRFRQNILICRMVSANISIVFEKEYGEQLACQQTLLRSIV